MGLLEDLSDEESLKPKSRNTCSLCEFLQSTTPEIRERLEKLLSDTDNVSNSGISNKLIKNKIRILEHTVSRHRKGLCRGARG